MAGWTVGQVLTTIFGSAMFPFLIGLIWGKFVEENRASGAVLAGFWIVGVAWLMNHGIGLIHEPQMANGGVWSDMALTAFWGLFMADVFRGRKVRLLPLITGLLAGILGGLVLTVLAPPL